MATPSLLRKVVRRSSESAVAECYLFERLVNEPGMANRDGIIVGSESAEVAASIDQRAIYIDALFQFANRLIDCETFGDATQVDHHAFFGKTDATFIEQFNLPVVRNTGGARPMAAREEAPFHQRRSNRHIEAARGHLRKMLGLLQNLISPLIDTDSSPSFCAIKASHVAVRIMKAHETMRALNEAKRAVNRAMKGGIILAARPHFDESAQQRTRSARFI